jgi:transcriptional regulator with XRE-family HTH domain
VSKRGTSERVAEAQIQAFYGDFGERLRRARGSLSQRALGERVGLSRGSISNIEAGRQHIPLHLLPLLADTLGVSPQDLLAPIQIRHDVDVTGLAAEERGFVERVIASVRPADIDVQS